jgi:hypothetical protein
MSATDHNEQDKHECKQSAGDDNQPAHVRPDVGEFLLPSQLNRECSGYSYAPTGARGHADGGRLWTRALQLHS